MNSLQMKEKLGVSKTAYRNMKKANLFNDKADLVRNLADIKQKYKVLRKERVKKLKAENLVKRKAKRLLRKEKSKGNFKQKVAPKEDKKK